jgi:hypothetical protein
MPLLLASIRGQLERFASRHEHGLHQDRAGSRALHDDEGSR